MSIDLNIIQERFKYYQPFTSSAIILSKALWKSQKVPALNREIRSLKKRIITLKQIPGTNQRVVLLQKELKAKQQEQIFSNLSVLQLGSLLFSNPGSNLWNAATSLANHSFSLHRSLTSPNIRKVAFSSLSTFAMGLSLLQHTGAIEEDDPLCRGIIQASLASQCVAVASQWLKKLCL